MAVEAPLKPILCNTHAVKDYLTDVGKNLKVVVKKRAESEQRIRHDQIASPTHWT